MLRRTPVGYAALAAVVLTLALVVGWVTAPRTEGLDGEWETEAVAGRVLAGRALVSDTSAIAIDLTTGTRITLGSVSGGTSAIGGGRLLVLDGTTLDGAGLDARSRWTWEGPPAHRLALVAAGPTTTVVQACGGTPVRCRLIGIDGSGHQTWQTPQPTASGAAAPVVGADGSLPSVGVLPTPDGTLMLIDPASSRVVLRESATATVRRDGRLVLSAVSGSGCTHTSFETIDRTTTATTPGPCPTRPASPSDTADGADGADGADAITPGDTTEDTRVTPTRARTWWWPFGDGRAALEMSGRHTGHVVGRDPLRTLRLDEHGITVLEDRVVRRFSWSNDEK